MIYWSFIYFIKLRENCPSGHLLPGGRLFFWGNLSYWSIICLWLFIQEVRVPPKYPISIPLSIVLANSGCNVMKSACHDFDLCHLLDQAACNEGGVNISPLRLDLCPRIMHSHTLTLNDELPHWREIQTSRSNYLVSFNHTSHHVLGPFNFNLSCPRNPMAVQVVLDFHAGHSMKLKSELCMSAGRLTRV